MAAYYNEIDPFAAQWLRNLIAAGHIAPGDVDERSILEVQADDLRGYDQCHFFAGIGGWSYALRLAGWADARPVWTGSCPCQPFSAAGKQRGSDDERHLWPAFFRLISECRPSRVFGEQVAGAAGFAWLDHVCADLEGAGYAAAAADLPACSVGAPHRRQRLYWVAHASGSGTRRNSGAAFGEEAGGGCARRKDGEFSSYSPISGGANGSMAHADAPGLGLERLGGILDAERPAQRDDIDGCGEVCGMGYAGVTGLAQQRSEPGTPRQAIDGVARKASERTDASTPWADCDWLPCSDGKARPTQPGLFPLAHGVSGRVGRLRAYGNAIVGPLAAAFIAATM